MPAQAEDKFLTPIALQALGDCIQVRVNAIVFHPGQLVGITFAADDGANNRQAGLAVISLITFASFRFISVRAFCMC